mgnify:CR=1 FL=1|jgi:hypothetical protein|tara:strand:+ start:613 stop:789 length:177 start_codon:yes stop_codon:yes gene_type:complete
MVTFTTDIDPNISILELLISLTYFESTLISLNEQPNLPLPSITISIPENRLEEFRQTV